LRGRSTPEFANQNRHRLSTGNRGERDGSLRIQQEGQRRVRDVAGDGIPGPRHVPRVEHGLDVLDRSSRHVIPRRQDRVDSQRLRYIQAGVDTAVDIGPGNVRLVTRNEDTGALVIARPRS
jgi:hypothetical protein